MKTKLICMYAIIAFMAIGIVGCSSSSSKDTKEEEKPKEKEFYAINEAVVLDDRTFTVTEVSKSAGEKYSKPKDGNEFVVVNVTIENTGEDEVSYNQLYFKMQNSQGQIESAGFSMFAQDSALGSGKLAKGGKKSGTIVVEQPIGDSDLTLIYQTEAIGGKEIKVKLQ